MQVQNDSAEPRYMSEFYANQETMERRYNQTLRQRRAVSLEHREPLDIIAHYDQLITTSDARLTALRKIDYWGGKYK